MVVNRFEIWLVQLDPTKGSEISKTRPCLVISPDTVNVFLNTVIVSPLTSSRKKYPTRVNCLFQNHEGQIALDQSRAVDKSRLTRKIGILENAVCEEVCQVLQSLFQY